MPNEAESRRWNDEQIVANWPKRERFTDRVVRHVVGALNPIPGERVLDVGCGGGNLSLAIAGRVGPGGKVTGADISAGMVKTATRRAEESKAKNVTFALCDMQTGTPPGGPFDAATSQFGVMFFDDPVAAFTNIRKSLKRGGRLAFACWQPGAKNNWCAFPVVAPFGPPPRPLPAGVVPTGPFALGDPRYTRNILTAAGFTGISREAKRLVTRVPAESVGDESVIAAAGVPAERRAEAAKALQKHLDSFIQADGLCRVELNIQLFTAQRG